MIRRTIVLALAASTLAACADNGQARNDAPDERAYVTGSNIPRKTPPISSMQTIPKGEVERVRDEMSRVAPTEPPNASAR